MVWYKREGHCSIYYKDSAQGHLKTHAKYFGGKKYVCGSLGLGDCFVCDSGICPRIILQISKKKKCLGKY